MKITHGGIDGECESGGRRKKGGEMRRFCVSACLLGIPCRWKGDARPCEAATRLADDPRVEVEPFCPELAAGLGCPRPPIELVRGEPGAPVRALRVDRTADATDPLRAACEAEAKELARAGGVAGFVLKSRSPSCGPSTPLHDPDGREIGSAPGIWAAVVRERFPDLPLWTEETFAASSGEGRARTRIPPRTRGFP